MDLPPGLSIDYIWSFLQVLSIYHYRDLITIYHGEQEGADDFDTVLLKTLVGGTPYSI